MARPKKLSLEVLTAETQEILVATETTDTTIMNTSRSEAYNRFNELIQRYKIQNPKKYALREKELLNKLNQL